jgi:very-short-patch-repair endonuclease
VLTDVVTRCRELLPALPTGAVFSHVTGLDLLGVDRPRGVHRPDEVHIEVPHTTRRPRRRGVASHSRTTSGRQPVVLRDGLPVLPPARLWTQLAGELDEVEVVVLGDALLRRTSARASAGDLRRAVDRLAPGTRGLRRLVAALPRLRAGTDSCQETRLRLALVDSGLPCPEVNRPVLDGAGRFVVLPDLSYPEQRVAVEYDGDVHRTEPRAWRRDVARRQALEHLGWRQITCTADDVRDPRRAVAWIRAALEREIR